jgi:hypothetical protein
MANFVELFYKINIIIKINTDEYKRLINLISDYLIALSLILGFVSDHIANKVN